MNKEKKKKKSLFKRPVFYIGLLQILSGLLLIFSIINIGILSLKFLIPIIIFIVLINFLILFFLFKKVKLKETEPYTNKKGKLIDPVKKAKNKKLIITIISIIFSIINIVGSIILINLASSMNNLFKNESYINYSVLVNKGSKYKEIDDLDNKIIGFYEGDKYSEESEKKLSKKVDCEFIGYATINELKYALITEEIDGMVIMDQYLDLDDDESDEETESVEEKVEENDEVLEKIEDFDKDTKVIYTFKIKVDNSKKTKKINLEKGSFVVYISGQDSYANEVSETSRSDVNMLMVVNLKTRQILLLTIPRDYYIQIKSKGAYDKLTHISLYGPEEAADSLGDVLDIDVDYYVKFNFTTFMKATEFLLPLDVYSDYEFTTSVYDGTIGDCYTFYEGYNHITKSTQALQFVRARKNFSEGDRQRGINQTRFLRAVINKTTSPSVLVKYNKILDALEGTFLTNISDESIIEIIKYILSHNGKFTINSISLDGSDAHKATYSGGSQQLYVMIPNQDTIDEASTAAKAVLDGEKPDIEQDKSETVSTKNSHDVTKAATNYGTSSTRKSYTNTNNQQTTTTTEEQQTVVEEEEKVDVQTEEKTTKDDNPTGGDEVIDDSGETTPIVDENET